MSFFAADVADAGQEQNTVSNLPMKYFFLSPHKYQVPLKALLLLAGASLEVKKRPQN